MSAPRLRNFRQEEEGLTDIGHNDTVFVVRWNSAHVEYTTLFLYCDGRAKFSKNLCASPFT